MRPKIVILILVIAAGLVAALVMLKGVTGRSSHVTQVTTPGEPSNQEPPVTAAVQTNPNSSNAPAMTPEEARAAQIQQDLDVVREALANGTVDPIVTEDILMDKVTNPEKEVRKAALEALTQLNDTNAIPRLQQAIQSLDDPHDKAAVLDAIAYLQLPETTPDTPPETNSVVPVKRPRPQQDPAARQANRQKRLSRIENPNPPAGSSSAAGYRPTMRDPANSSQPQPATPAPDNPPPQ